MGTQQFLFTVLGIVTVGIAIAVGVNMFTTSYADRINEVLLDKVYDIELKANTYRKRPVALGGGGGSYKGFDDQIKGILKDEVIEKLKINAKKERLDLTLTLKGDEKKSGKIEVRYDPDGIDRLRIYDPDERKWEWLIKEKGSDEKGKVKNKK